MFFLFFSVLRGNLIMFFFFFQAEDGIRDLYVTGVQTCALPIWCSSGRGALSSPLRRDWVASVRQRNVELQRVRLRREHLEDLERHESEAHCRVKEIHEGLWSERRAMHVDELGLRAQREAPLVRVHVGICDILSDEAGSMPFHNVVVST